MITRHERSRTTTEHQQALLWAGGGAAWVANAMLGLDAADRSSRFYATEVVWVGVHVLVLFGLVGLWRSDVGRASRWGRRALAIAIAGRVWFTVCELAAIGIGHDELPIFPVAVISTAFGMTAAGVVAMGTRPWRGWRPASLTAMGAYPLLVIVPTFAATGQRPPDPVVAGWGLTFFAIAAAWATRPSTSEAQPSARPTAAEATTALV
jgi:hypothetical protein